MSGNFEYWLAHGLKPLSVYRPEVETLKSGAPRVIVAIGEDSRGQPIEAMALAFARAIGIAPAAFPGDHMGFETDVAGFAAALDAAFGN